MDFMKTYNEMKQNSQHLEEKNGELDKEIQLLKIGNDELKKGNDALKRSNDELKRSNDALKRSNDTLERSNDLHHTRNQLLEQQNEALQNELKKRYDCCEQPIGPYYCSICKINS